LDEKGQPKLREEVAVSKEAPPMFFVHAYDDGVSVFNTLLLATELKKVGVPAEVHVYATGGHGYGLRHVDGQPVTDWPKPCEAWLKTTGVIR
jgi:acetyl esterase/lipase